MRHDQVVRMYLSMKEASSREWGISETLVMCVELDMSADSHVTALVASSSSRRRRGPRFMRMTVFRRMPGSEPGTPAFHGFDVVQVRAIGVLAGGSFTLTELRDIESRAQTVDRWIEGSLEDLPPSTSSEVADSLRRTLKP